MCFCQKSKMQYPRICLFTTQLIVGNNVRQQTSFNKFGSPQSGSHRSSLCMLLLAIRSNGSYMVFKVISHCDTQRYGQR